MSGDGVYTGGKRNEGVGVARICTRVWDVLVCWSGVDVLGVCQCVWWEVKDSGMVTREWATDQVKRKVTSGSPV